MLRYLSDEEFLLILVFNDRSIPCVTNMRIKMVLCKIQYRYRTVRCFAMYGTIPVLFYGTSKCNYPSRDVDYCFYNIFLNFVTIVSSLHCRPRLTAVAARPLLASRAPPTTVAPTLLAIALLAPTIPICFSIDLWLNVFYLMLRLLVAVPHEDVSKKTSTTWPRTRWAKPSFSPRPW